MDVPKRYDPKTAEPKWVEFWEKEGTFTFDPESDREIYSIDTPPPYASAAHLHIGHAMHYTQFEFMARYKRMRGYNVFFPMGWDDNGLPTERFVEKKYNIDKSSTSRSEFIKRCMEETKRVGETYKKMWQDVGLSVDWSLLYSTISPHAQKIAQRSFIDLFRKGRMVRREDPVMWCTQCQTAIAQADLDDLEKQSQFNTIKFRYAEDGADILIGTTRPELIPACVALFVHPEDDRYQEYVGKKAKIPLTDREVPIIADESVDPDVGTGFMMVCTWGDAEDVDKWKRYTLDTRCIIDERGRLTIEAYKGMTLLEARKAILNDLKAHDLVTEQKTITHVTNVHERCKTPVEFYQTPQWFIKVLDKKDELLHQVEQVTWHPEHMKARMRHWIENLKWDWCISRQRFFGVPFPVWYCNQCHEIVLPEDQHLPVNPADQEAPVACQCGHTDLVSETDVMDTWMISSLSPQLTLNWGEHNSMMNHMFPMSLRPQAHDIIRTWAFYTITKSFYHEAAIPWYNIMISGHGQDPHGRKMSKSLGNVVTANEVIEKYSADALRFWSASVSLGEDLPYQEKDVSTGQKTINKLWNATKFAFMHLEDFDPQEQVKLEEIDRWLLHCLHKTIESCTKSFDDYGYARAKADTEYFFWKLFCDNYLEIIKDRVYNPESRGEEARKSAQYVLYHSLLNTIKLFAPIMPFITEEIYQTFFRRYEQEHSIHTSAWPLPQTPYLEYEHPELGDFMLYAIETARRAKSERQVSLKSPIKRFTIKAKVSPDLVDRISRDLCATTKTEELIYEQIPQDANVDYETDLVIE